MDSASFQITYPVPRTSAALKSDRVTRWGFEQTFDVGHSICMYACRGPERAKVSHRPDLTLAWPMKAPSDPSSSRPIMGSKANENGRNEMVQELDVTLRLGRCAPLVSENASIGGVLAYYYLDPAGLGDPIRVERQTTAHSQKAWS